MNFSLGSFKSSDDVDQQLTNYKQLLAAQIRINKRQEDLNRAAWKDGISIPQPPQMIYRNSEQELADQNLQYQKAFASIQQLFKYSNDAKAVIDNLAENYNLVDVNRFLPSFLGELKSTVNLTPSYFLTQWDRFYTRVQSTGDSIINVGILDDRARYFVQQEVNLIKSFIKNESDLAPRQLDLINKRLDKLVQQAGLSEMGGKGKVSVLETLKDDIEQIKDFNQGNIKISPVGKTFEEKKQSIADERQKIADNIVKNITSKMGLGKAQEKLSKIATELEKRAVAKLPELKYDLQEVIKRERQKLDSAEKSYKKNLKKAQGNLNKQRRLLDEYSAYSEEKLAEFKKINQESLQDLWDKFYSPQIESGKIDKDIALQQIQKEQDLIEKEYEKLKLENDAKIDDFLRQIKSSEKKAEKSEAGKERIKKIREKTAEPVGEFTPIKVKPKFRVGLKPKPSILEEKMELEFKAPSSRRGSLPGDIRENPIVFGDGMKRQRRPRRTESVQQGGLLPLALTALISALPALKDAGLFGGSVKQSKPKVMAKLKKHGISVKDGCVCESNVPQILKVLAM